MSETRGISKLERSIRSTFGLEREQAAVYVIQAVLSVNPNIPEWCDVTWTVFGKSIAKWARDPHRIGSGGDAPKFSNIETALEVLLAARRALKGKYRLRLIIRFTDIHECLIQGDGR